MYVSSQDLIVVPATPALLQCATTVQLIKMGLIGLEGERGGVLKQARPRKFQEPRTALLGVF